MTTYRFDTDTATRPVPGGVMLADLDPQWNVDGRILNGGYLQSVTTRAVVDRAGAGATPVAVSTTFAATARPGPAEVEVTLFRTGSSIVSASATMRQQGAVVVSSLVTLAVGDALPHGASSYPLMPSVTGAADSIRLPVDALPGPPGLATLIDYAFVPEDSGWLQGMGTGEPHIRCWLAFADGRPVDVLAAIAMMDLAPPVCFAEGRFGWAPTLQLQVGVFARPQPGPMLLDVRGEPYDGAVVAEDGLLWDSAGTLVARSRQIALAPRV